MKEKLLLKSLRICKISKLNLICFVYFCLVLGAFSQDSFSALPKNFKTIQLGMSLNEVKAALLRDSQFGYRGDRDVSLIPSTGQQLIETSGNTFLDKCWFQFYDGSLYIMTINMNQKEMDYFSVFNTLCKKYGNPTSLSPDKASWNGSSVIMTLEKPLAIKYTDAEVYSKIQNEAFVDNAAMEIVRQEFLDSL